jgi:4-oxalomesaconate tautomerase
VPKISLIAPPAHGGAISTRTFIPVRVHESIGVLGAVSVGTAIMVPGAVGHDLAVLDGGPRLSIEHPSGALQVEVELDTSVTPPRVIRSGVVRTARKLFDGTVFPRLLTPAAPARPRHAVKVTGRDQRRPLSFGISLLLILVSVVR